MFLPPWGAHAPYIASFPPFLFERQRDGWLVSNTTDGDEISSIRIDPVAIPHIGKQIESINGLQPEAYMKQILESYGNYKSAGARLNHFLSTTGLLAQAFLQTSSVIIPGDGRVVVVLNDGSSFTAEWKSAFLWSGGPTDVNKPSVDVLRTAWSTNPLFDVLNAAFNLSDVTPPEERVPFGGAARRRLYAEESHEVRVGDLKNHPPLGQRGYVRRLESTTSGVDTGEDPVADAVTVAHSPTLSKSTFWQLSESGENISMAVYLPTTELGKKNGISVSTSTLPSGKVITTWKLNQFSLAKDGSSYAPSFDLFQETSELAVTLAAEHSDGVLIVDVIGNGGGIVILGQWCVPDSH